MAIFAHACVDFLEIGPIDRALEGVDHDAVVLEILAHIGIVETAALPGAHDEARRGHGAMPGANALRHARDMAAKPASPSAVPSMRQRSPFR